MAADGFSQGGEPPLEPGEPRSFGSGRFVVRRRLGAGNFATVYLAYDERLDVPVAVKLLSDRWSWEPEVRGRFVQEARLLRSLNDARVVQIRDIAETDDGRPYLVMDYATRGTLEQRLVEATQREVRPDNDQLRTVAAAMAEALGVMHARRIAHRDIKPSNLLITTARHDAAADDDAVHGPTLLRPGERLMLGDLGLAKDLSFDSGVTAGVGTAGYMAPEQTLPGAKIDTRADIYAASALLAQVASGEAPDPVRRYEGGEIRSGRPLSPLIPNALAAALKHGLDTDPDQRPQTIEEWYAEVDQALVVPPVAPVATSDRRSHRRRVAVIAAAAAATAAAVVGGGAVGVVVLTDDKTTDTTVAGRPSLTLVGPRELTVGEQGLWTVDRTADIVSGTWSLEPVEALNDASWTPDSRGFQGAWPEPGRHVLTLTAVTENGETARDDITFTVT